MPWRNGGVIGRRNLPTQAVASGVWRLSEIDAAKRESFWPTNFISPLDLQGLTLWLDGADSSTMYDATTGGSLVAADGVVARWQDKSGSSRHFTQATSGLRPTRRAAVKNGLDAIEFTNDWLSGVYTYGIGSLFVVWNHPTTVVGDTLPGIVGSRTSSSTKVANGDLDYGLMLPSATNAAVSPNRAGTYRLNGVTQGAEFNNFSTGTAVRTSPDRWQYTSATFSPVTGQKAIVLGGDSFSTVRLMQNGHVAEVIASSDLLTTAQVATVETYLVNKWGLA